MSAGDPVPGIGHDGPPFGAPWQAQAFAMTIALYERGLFSWPEWTAVLAEEIARAQGRGDPDTGESYYQHWLRALERIVTDKGLCEAAHLQRLRAACRSRSVPRISSPSLPPRGAGSSLGARRSPWREESMSERAVVREVGLRDGLQSLAETMPTEQKIAWLEAEYRAGVRDIEVSSFVPPKLLPQLADAEAVVRHALSLPGLTVSALIPNLKGAERGLALGVHEMNFVLSVSESHNRAN